MKAQIMAISIFLVMSTVFTNAQAQDRVYPIPELTDEMRKEIDLTDGSIEEWFEILGEPSLTPLDFQSAPMGIGIRPILVGLPHLGGLARFR